MSYSVVDRQSPLSFLQQRLNYTSKIERPLTFLVENVPQWFKILNFSPVLTKNITSYANCQGEMELLEAIRQREAQHYDLQINSDQILVTNGAFHGISLLTRYLFQSGSQVLCQTPVLDSVEKILRSQGYEIVYFSIDENDNYADVLQQQMQAGIRLIYLNSPHNPTGRIISKREWEQLLKWAVQCNIAVIADLVYDSFIFDSSYPLNPLVLQQDWQNLFVVNSMSKNYGAPGLRIGWIITHSLHIAMLTSQLEAECISVCTSSQYQAVELIKWGNSELVTNVTADWLFVQQQLAILPNVDFKAPAGGTQYFVNLPVTDVEAFADFMLVEYGLVLVTSGNYVKSEGAYIRIPLGQARETVVHGIELLAKGLNRWC